MMYVFRVKLDFSCVAIRHRVSPISTPISLDHTPILSSNVAFAFSIFMRLSYTPNIF